MRSDRLHEWLKTPRTGRQLFAQFPDGSGVFRLKELNNVGVRTPVVCARVPSPHGFTMVYWAQPIRKAPGLLKKLMQMGVKDPNEGEVV